jgi:hypothetical protein
MKPHPYHATEYPYCTHKPLRFLWVNTRIYLLSTVVRSAYFYTSGIVVGNGDLGGRGGIAALFQYIFKVHRRSQVPTDVSSIKVAYDEIRP